MSSSPPDIRKPAIIALMRRRMLWCLLMLLPWRLWAAGIMLLQPCATDASAGYVAASVQLAPVHGPSHAGHGSLHGASDDATVQPSANAHTGCDQWSPGHTACTVCDVCHNPPLVLSHPARASDSIKHHWALTQVPLHPTLLPAPPRKPPIA